MPSHYATPRYPGAPYSTPASQSASRKVPRAPIINPFEQFPESEFQSWIGDITGAIKAALGRDDPEARTTRAPERVEHEEETLEDSFADIMARRAAKGKERAVEVGDEEQPIVIGSDDEEEQESEEVARAIAVEDEDQDSGLEEDGEQPGAEAEVVAQVYGQANEDAEEEEYSDQSGDEDGDGDGDGDEDEAEDEDDEEEAPTPVAPSAEVIDLLSDDEEEEVEPVHQARHEKETADAEEFEARSDEEYEAAVAKLEHRLYAPYEDEKDELDDDEDDDGKGEDEDEDAVSTQPAPAVAETPEPPYTGFVEEDAAEHDASAIASRDQLEQEVVIADPWEGPNTFAEDYYSGGDLLPQARDAPNAHILPTEEEDDEIVEVAGPASGGEPIEPAGLLITAEEAQEVQLPDPWSGPRLYAEDYYSGGDLRESDLRTRLPSPSYLTPAEEELTDFLTPDAGTPEGVPLRTDGHDESTEVRSGEHQYSLVEELYADVANDISTSGGLDAGAAIEQDEDAEEDQPLSGLSDSPSPPKFTSHVDWNWPPAFPAGRLASRAGHLQSPGMREIVEISDDEVDSPAMSIAPLPADQSEALPVGATQAVDETTTVLSQACYGPFEAHLQDLTRSDVDTPEVPSQHDDQQSVEDLYADLDAFITSGQEQILENERSGAMSSEEADAFLRDFLTGPPSEDLDVTETTVDVVVAETLVETPVPPADPHEVAGHGEQSNIDGATPGDVDSEAHLRATVEVVEYEVEEPITEGRRTAEPGDACATSPSIITEELSDREDSAVRLVVDIREYAVSEPDSHFAADADTLDLEDYDVPAEGAVAAAEDAVEYIDLSAQADDPADIIEAPVAEEADVPVVQVESVHYERELEPGVPMPVAADPTVPDPTSVAPSPKESVPVTPVEVDTSTSRSSSVSGSVSSRRRSPSGLFTPLTAENSRPPSPNLRSSDLDTHYESPLKHAVTAEQLADEAASASSASIDDASVQPENDHDSALSTQSLAQSSVAPTEDLDDSQPAIESVDATELDELNLEYPSDTEEPAVISAEDSPRTGEEVVPDANVDADADGDVDPDCAPLRHAPSVARDLVEDAEVVAITEPAVEAPTNGEAVAVSTGPDDVEDASGVASEGAKNGVPLDDGPEQDTHAKQNGDVLSTASADATAASGSLGEMDDPFTSGFAQGPKDEGDDASVSSDPSSSRALKRKRETSYLPPRVTRALLRKRIAVDPPTKSTTEHLHATKGKERSPSREVDDEDRQTVESPSEGQNAEGKEAIAATQTTTVPSRPTSRSSSVVSAALTGETSATTSPTTNRTQTHELPRLIDAQEVMHHHHGRRVLQATVRMLGLRRQPTVQIPEPVKEPSAQTPSPTESELPSPSVPVPPSRPTAPTPPSASPADASLPTTVPSAPDAESLTAPGTKLPSPPPLAPEFGPSTPPSTAEEPVTTTPPPLPSTLPPRLRLGHSPVTRSRCRFHKISLPREENGPPIFFVVPGCALTNTELMKEEDIVDHGIPTFPQGTKLLADLDLLNLNPYLMGVLRQLVGVDMLREQEIFYLPQEGEQYAWKPKRHHKHTAPKTKLSARARKSIGAPIQSAPDSHGHDESVSAAPSRAGSVSTVSSRQSRKSRASTRGSTANSASVAGSEYSDGSDVEDDDDSVRSTKRRRTEIAVSPPVENGGDTEAPVPKVSATASKKIGPLKRTRKIGKDASAYKPDPTDEQGSSDEEPTSRRTRRKTKRGTKRPRADEAAEETVVGIAPPKRRRVRQKPAEANGEEK